MILKKWNCRNKKIELRFFSSDNFITLLVEYPQNVAYKDRYLIFNKQYKEKTFSILKKLFFARD